MPQEDILTEESAYELTARDSIVPAPSDVYEAMIALKDNDNYKEGTREKFIGTGQYLRRR